MPKKGQTSVTHISTCIFQGFLRNLVFRSVAFVTKQLWDILDVFFSLTRLYFCPIKILLIISHKISQ